MHEYNIEITTVQLTLIARNICNINADMQIEKYIFERIKILKNMK